jgi:hypothetical protein
VAEAAAERGTMLPPPRVVAVTRDQSSAVGCGSLASQPRTHRRSRKLRAWPSWLEFNDVT